MVKISGIYAYYDKKRNKFVYVGKDSNIYRNARHRAHMAKSRYNEQPFNRILQDNPDRYLYQVLVWGVPDEKTLNALEIMYIKNYKTYENGFNFTDGGDGVCGYKHTKQAREKISHALSGKNNPMYGKTGKKSHMYGKKHSKETRKKMSEAQKGENHPQFNSCIKIRKQECKSCTQGFRWSARPHIPEKQKTLSSVDLEKCIEKVEDFIQSNENVYCYESYEVID